MDYEEILLPILNKAVQAAEATGDFVIEQSPLVLQEFMLWTVVKYGGLCAIGLILMIIVPLMARSFAGGLLYAVSRLETI